MLAFSVTMNVIMAGLVYIMAIRVVQVKGYLREYMKEKCTLQEEVTALKGKLAKYEEPNAPNV